MKMRPFAAGESAAPSGMVIALAQRSHGRVDDNACATGERVFAGLVCHGSGSYHGRTNARDER